MKTPDRKTQPLCDEWWPVGRCVAYIIGVGDEWSFPHRAAAKGCAVHGYDPTAPLREVHFNFARMHNFTFHYMGLSGESKQTTFNSYGTVDGGGFLATLDAMAMANQPDQRSPNIISIDCEGCEWAALEEMSRNPKTIRLLKNVHILYLDLHFHLRNPPSVRQFVHALDFIFVKMQFKLRWLRNGDGYPGDQKVVDFLGTAGLPGGFCCYELALVRG